MTSAQRLLAVTGISMFAFLGAIQALYGPLLPGLRKAFAIDNATVGLIFTAHGLGALLGIFIPSLSKSAKLARRWLTIATGLVLLGASAFSIAPTWATTLAAAFVLALGFGIHVIRLNSVFISGFGSQAMTMSQLLNASFSIGCILGPVALGLVGTPSPHLFAAIATVALALLPICALTDRRSMISDSAPRTTDRSTQALATQYALLTAFMLLMSLAVGVENSIAGWTATLALADGYSYAAAANLTAAFFGCVLTGRLLAAGLAHRMRAPMLVIGAVSCVAVCMSCAVLSGAAPLAMVATGFAIAPSFAAILVWLQTTLPTMRHANALVIGGALIGSALYPPLVGRVIGSLGVAAAPPAILGLAVAGLLVAAAIFAAHRKLHAIAAGHAQ